MKKTMFVITLLGSLFLLSGLAFAKGFPYGRVKVVKAFPDYKVKVVKQFADYQVRIVKSFPDREGCWQFVDKFPDFTIKYVDSFPDFTVQFVDR